jgi:hypothetical protein
MGLAECAPARARARCCSAAAGAQGAFETGELTFYSRSLNVGQIRQATATQNVRTGDHRCSSRPGLHVSVSRPRNNRNVVMLGSHLRCPTPRRCRGPIGGASSTVGDDTSSGAVAWLAARGPSACSGWVLSWQ